MVPVTAVTVAAQVRELKRTRREAAIWRYGAASIVALTAVWSLVSLRDSTQALINPGPTQDQFASALGSGLQQDVVPQLQSMAGQTLSEMKPQVIQAFQHVQSRAPEVANAGAKELNTLQADVASQSEHALDQTFSQELKKREPKIREMFPNVTDEQMQTFVNNMTTMGEKHITSAHDRLLSKHMEAMSSIVTDMTRIQDTEKTSLKGDAAPWQVTLNVLDLVREDLKPLANTSNTTVADASVATTGPALAKGTK